MTNPAEGYESCMVPALFRPWATILIQAAAPKPGERILDVGCGTGIVARQVASQLQGRGTIAGLDLSPDMLAVARATAAREGLSIEWREGRAEQLPFSERSFELVLSQFALMFCADKVAALSEMRRVATDSGRVLLSVWQGLEQHPFYQTLHEVIQQRLGISSLQDIFALGSADELRAMMVRAGFQRIEVEPMSRIARFPNPDGFLAGEIEVDTAAIPALQHLDAEARQKIVSAISAAMQSPLRKVTHGDQVVIRFHAHLVRAWR